MAVGLATVFGHPVMGAILGFVLSCMIFIFEINRPNVGLTDHMTIAPSKRMRSLKQQEVLAATAHERVLITLRGILFFGTAGQLISKVEALDSSVRVIILDFHKVINAGISGVAALQQVARQLERQNRKLYISGLSNADPTWGSDSLPPGVFFFGSSDDALEYAEDEALVSIGREIGKEIALDQTDFGAIMSVSELTILKEHLRRVTFKQGETLCREGEPSDCLWVLVKGSVGIWASSGSQRHRINSIGLGCIVGEMGLLDQQPRFADAVADEDIAAYELTREQLADLLRMHPFIGQALLQDIIRQLTHRLRRLSQIDD
jgi:SulP family sulfate permease